MNSTYFVSFEGGRAEHRTLQVAVESGPPFPEHEDPGIHWVDAPEVVHEVTDYEDLGALL